MSDMVANQGVLQAGEIFMRKSLSPMNLAVRIREVLDNNEPVRV
jgi:hypothetical protein